MQSSTHEYGSLLRVIERWKELAVHVAVLRWLSKGDAETFASLSSIIFNHVYTRHPKLDPVPIQKLAALNRHGPSDRWDRRVLADSAMIVVNAVEATLKHDWD